MKTTIKRSFLLGGDMEINRMGYGAMRIIAADLFGMPDSPQNSIDVLRRAVELGVNFIDTADQYGPFVSEELIAEALNPYPKDLIIGTKGGLVRFGPWADINNDASPQHLQEALEGSLRRLKVDQIDLYQLHRIDPKVPAQISYASLAKFQSEGKIRHLGLSEVSVEDIKQAQQHFKVVSVQNRYSVLERQWESVLEYCIAEGIAFIPWFPIGGGMTPMTAQLEQIASRKGVSVRQLALSWLLHRADNILLIPGTANLGHLEENINAMDIQLNVEEMEELNNLAG